MTMQAFRIAAAAALIATSTHAGGLAPSVSPPPARPSYAPLIEPETPRATCPRHTPWTLCQGEKDGPEHNSAPEPQPEPERPEPEPEKPEPEKPADPPDNPCKRAGHFKPGC